MHLYSYRLFQFLIIGITCSLSEHLVAQQTISFVKHPEWSYNQTIYEVNVRQYSAEGTFKAFERDLPRLKEMGVGIVWLMPIHPIGKLNRKGTLGSQYSVKDFLAINPEFGTESDFRSLVNRTHELGMYLIIDWVANHCAWDNKLLEEHHDWFTKNADGKFIPPVDDWTDVVDFNYDNKELWLYMTNALKFWVREYNIDGFRCDVAGLVPTEFWNQARAELDKIKPVFMLAEWETPEMHEKAFDMTYSWDLFKIFNSIAKGEKNAWDIIKYLEMKKNQYPQNAFRMRFTSNHDENTWNGTEFERLGDAAETFAALTVVIPGMPLVYNGQEAGMNKRLKFFEKDPIEWREHRFAWIYQKLLNFKMNSSVLQNGERGAVLEKINSSNNESIFAFIRQDAKQKVLAIFNLSDKSTSFTLKHKNLHGKYSDVLSGEEVSYSEREEFVFKSWEYKILKAN